jgi:DNA-binding NarL/FixJ family response regulator
MMEETVPIDTPPAFLRGRRILVVEDEPLVSMMIEDALVEAGGNVIGPAGTAEEALELLDRTDIHCAVLDIKLMNGSSQSVAEGLARRGIRFMVLTGIDESQVPPEYKGAPVVQKVFAAHELVDAVAGVLAKPMPSP